MHVYTNVFCRVVSGADRLWYKSMATCKDEDDDDDDDEEPMDCICLRVIDFGGDFDMYMIG